MSQHTTKNNPEPFTEILKNIDQLKNNGRIKNTLGTTKLKTYINLW